MPAVADSSPLILYAVIGRLVLLHHVFGEIVVPPAVWDEVVVNGAGRPGALETERAAWIRRPTWVPRRPFPAAFTDLGPGEAESITLALDLGTDTPIILDDHRGRRVAHQHGLTVVGSAGVLVEAKVRGLITHVRPALKDLRGAGLYLSEAAMERLLAMAGE